MMHTRARSPGTPPKPGLVRRPLLHSLFAVVFAFSALALAGCGKHPRVYRAGGLLATEAVASPGAGASGVTAAFLMIRNRSDAADELVKVTSPNIEAIEFHEAVEVGGVRQMRNASTLAIPAGERLTLAPGGKHLMLFGLDPALKEGDRVPLSLTFRNGTTIEAELALVADAAEHFSRHADHHSGGHGSGSRQSGPDHAGSHEGHRRQTGPDTGTDAGTGTGTGTGSDTGTGTGTGTAKPPAGPQ